MDKRPSQGQEVPPGSKFHLMDRIPPHQQTNKKHHAQMTSHVGLGGLGVTCSPRDPRFAGSNPADVDGFFQDVKNPEHKSSGRDFKQGV